MANDESITGPQADIVQLKAANERLRLDLSESRRLEAELKARARQQAAVAELGQRALVGTNLSILVDEVVSLVAETLDVEYSKIFELDHLTQTLILRAGVGLQPGLVGQVTMGVNGRSQAGYTLLSQGPVVVEDLAAEERFRPLPLLTDHNIVSSMSVIIQGRDRPFGVLGAHTTRRRTFTEDDVHFLQAVANVLAMAIDRKQAETQIVSRNRALLTLQMAGTAIVSSLDLQYVLDTVTREMANLLDVNACTISDWNHETGALSPLARHGLAGWIDRQSLDEAFALANYALTRQVLIDQQARQVTPGRPDLPPAEAAYLQANKIKSLLMLPLIFQGQPIGLVEVIDKRAERTFGQQEILLAQLLANQAASAIANARLHAEPRKMLREQIALRDAGAIISSTLDLDTVLSHIAEEMGRTAEATSAYICSFEPETMTSTVLAEYFDPQAGPHDSDLGHTYDLSRDSPATIAYLQAGQPRLLHVDDDDLSPFERSHMQRYGAKSILIIPLQIGGQTIAYAELWENRQRRKFTPPEIDLCQGIAQQAAIAMENARLFEQTQAALDETAMLYRAARALARMDNEQEMFEMLLTEYLKYLNLKQGGVLIIDEDKAYGALKAHMVDGQLVEPGLRIMVTGNPSLDRLIENRQPVVITDALHDKLVEPVRELNLKLGIKSLLLVPIMVRGEVVGALGADSTEAVHQFTPREISLVKAMADQLGIAIENNRLQAETKRRALQLTVLHELDRAITKNLTPNDIYYVFARHAIRLLPYDRMSITMIENDRIRVVFVTGQGEADSELPVGTTLPLKTSAVGRVATQGQPLLRHKVGGHSNFAEDKRLAAGGLQSSMILPLRAKGEVIGTWNIASRQIGAYNPDDLEIGQALAEQLAITIENARLYHEIHQYLEELTTLNMISQIITSTLDLQEMLTIITHHTIQLLDVEATSVALYDEAREELWFAAASGGGAEFVRERRLKVGQGVIGSVAEHGEPVLVPDTSKAPDFYAEFDQESSFTTRSIMCVPLQTKGQIIGAIEALNKNGLFDQDDLRMLSSLASSAAAAIENARLFKQAQQEIGERKRAEAALQDTIERLEMSNRQAMIYAQELNAEITERKRAEAALEKERALLAQRVAERTADLSAANEELARAARLKDEFLASMSHELRTPLSAILGLSEVLKGEIYGPLNPKQLRSLASIEESGRHLLALINDILDLSKIGAGKLELQIDRVPVAAVCQASLRLIKQAAHQKKIEVSSKLDDSVTILQADERRLKQILVNLLSNAVKFTPEGGAVGLEVAGDRNRQEVDFTVWDTGIGIPEEGVQQLFQPFVQLNTGLSRQFAGTGLGLALVQRMVELHQGRLSVESEVDRGSRFTVSLPWQDPSRPPESVEQIEPVPPAGEKTLSPEPNSPSAGDEAPPIEDFSRYLRWLGVETVVQAPAETAVETARQVKPDLIILDQLAGGLPVEELLPQLRAALPGQEISFLVISENGEPNERPGSEAAESPVTLTSPQELRQALNRILTGKSEGPVQTVLTVTADGQPGPAAPPPQAPLILLVEDDTNLATFMINFLTAKGYRTIIAWNGVEALEQARQKKPDVILMDVQMPEMDGLEATRRLRAETDPELATVPIIALTALAMSGDRERCLKAGVDHYLSKPIKLRELTQAIEILLRKRR